jgi:DNA-binding response OmpR family regulator
MNAKEKPSILLVEDEKALSSIIIDTLEDEGFSTLKAFDGSEGLRLFFEKSPDLMIVDVMMPKMDGFEMVGKIRATNKTMPILFLTARSSIEDLEVGFALGANDYLRKPFKMKELIIRVKVLLNRNITEKSAQTVFHLGNYIFDTISQTLTYKENTIMLSHLENAILSRLCLNINCIVENQSLLLEFWHDDSIYNSNSLHGYIHKLRKRLQKDDTVAIISIRGIGYKLLVHKEIESKNYG